MAVSANLGFPRIGAHRELKRALESYWKGEMPQADLLDVAKQLRAQHLKRQQDAGITMIPSGDFSFYDQVLDHTHMFGAIPARYESLKHGDPLTLYFAMARGHQKDGVDVVAMEMTKWFDTNYHYIVPEFSADTEFALTTNHTLSQFEEAKAAGITTRPVVIGPVTYLLLGKMRGQGEVLSLLPRLLPVYKQLLASLKAAGAGAIQIDEPFLAMDICDATRHAYEVAFDALKTEGLALHLTTYFAGLRDNTQTAFNLPVDSVHIDLVREPEGLKSALAAIKPRQTLSLGLVNGRNIWKIDAQAALALADEAVAALGKERVIIAPSCSLLHSPVDLANETMLDGEIKGWMSFAQQKLEEVVLLNRAVNEGRDAVKQALAENSEAMASRANSSRIHNPKVKARLAEINDAMLARKSAFNARIGKQETRLKLPLFPTTTIGSFPQTAEIREARAKFKRGEMTQAQYDAYLEEKTRECINYQVDADMDMPVHGEFERNDMVEYFGEQLAGYVFTQNGWVQSYGSRCVKPPVIFGDVSRPEPMTVRWTKFAQSLTDRPVKGMLTGPITILQWSFVRDDQPREVTCKQIALAIRDEVADLEKAGIYAIQIDEPAIREGLPLRSADRAAYLKWAVDSFRLSAACVDDGTQIHTHMCYSEFNDIMDSIAALDADVISIETSRSAMDLLQAFVDFKYPNQIGPGVYDIHSPRVPAQSEMEHLLRKALQVLQPHQVWVNPDCGLKTRGWKEVDPALRAMVAAAKSLRSEYAAAQKKTASA